jgi:hypothetical protein
MPGPDGISRVGTVADAMRQPVQMQRRKRKQIPYGKKSE